MDYDQLVQGYARWMRSWDASARTIEARTTLARARLKEWGLEGFTAANVQGFLAGGDGWSKWTKATYHAHLKSLCEYLVAAGYLPASPMDDVRRVQRPRSLPRPLSDAEMSLALAEARRHPDPRLLDWITLARRAGLRCHEIAKIGGQDLTELGLYVLGKGGKEAYLPIHPEITAIAMRRAPAGYWFPSRRGGPLRPSSLSVVVSNFFTRLGIAGSIHRVRHNFGTDLLRAGVDLRTVQELMRHSSLATTAVYTAVDTDRLTDAINLLPSFGSPDAA